MKPWRVSDPVTCNEEDFATEAEALAYAEELLKGHREEAGNDGEWPEETGRLRVYKLAHSAQIVERSKHPIEGEWAEYGIRPVA